MQVAIGDCGIDMATATRVLAGTGAQPILEADHWAGDDIVAIIVAPPTEVRAADLERCPNLKIVVTLSTGVDNLDMDVCRIRQVAVWHPTDYCSDEVADSAIALLLDLLRGTVFLDRSVRAGEWDYEAAGILRRIDETRLGILGFGTIGRKVAKRARALNMAVSTYDPFLSADAAEAAGIEVVELDELFETSTAITVHVPLNESTQNIVSRDRLARMPRGSILVNLARAGIIDIDAVLEALTSGQLSGAALDVLEVEPPTEESPAPQHLRLIVTPHAAWYSEQSIQTLSVRPLEVVRDVLLGNHVSDLELPERPR
jgi:D-3-phosphoglycerate dehydrogenase